MHENESVGLQKPVEDAFKQRYGLPLQEYVFGFYFGLYYQVYHPLNILFCATGLVTNFLNIAILTRPAMKENTMNFLFTTLAISDIIFVIGRVSWSVPYYLCKTITDFVTVTTEMHYNGLFTIETSCILSSEWLNVTIGVWRLVAVTWPLRARYLCSQKRARNIVIFIAVSSILFNLPHRLMTHRCSYDLNGMPVSIIIARQYNNYLVPLHLYYVFGAVLVLLPVLAAVFITSCLIRKMYTTLTSLSHGLSVATFKFTVSGIKSTTRMLTIILAIFICTYASSSILYVSYYTPILGVARFRNIFLFLQTVDKSTTFFIYFSMSRTFRKTCRDIFFY